MDNFPLGSGLRPTYRTTTLALRELPAQSPSTGSLPLDSVVLSGGAQGANSPRTPAQMSQWFAQANASGAAGGITSPRNLPPASVVEPAPAGKPDRYFQYNARPLRDLRGAVSWSPGSARMSGTAANDQITNDYQYLNGEMQRYLKGDPNGKKLPPVTDFAGMAKFGSRLAGEQIRNLEDLQKAANGDVKAGTDAARNMANGQVIEQGVKMTGASARRNGSDESGLLVALAPGLAGAKVAGEMAADTVITVNKMRDTLVQGNTTIHDSAGRAYDAFLKGESSGEGGMEALQKAGYYPGSKEDPMGMYTQAFTQYKEARELSLQAQNTPDRVAQNALLKKRETLMKEANIKLFIHEQKSLEAPTMYGDKDIKNAVGAIGGSMTLNDPFGEYRLLPNGGDWTDFNKRMGFVEVAKGTAGAIDVLNKDGSHTHYLVDPGAVGTVSHYSNQRTRMTDAWEMCGNAPKPLHQAPTTSTGQGVDRIGSNLSQGNVVRALGDTLQMPDRLLADAAASGGKAIQSHAEDYGMTAYQKMTDPNTGTLGTLAAGAELTGAALQKTLGDGVEAVGDGLKAVGRWRDEAWNWVFN